MSEDLDVPFVQRLGFATLLCGLFAIPYYWAALQVGIPAEMLWIVYGLVMFGAIMVASVYGMEESTTNEYTEAET